jgi:hypothetical protein
MCNLPGEPSQELFGMRLLKPPIKYDLEENIFWFVKLVKVSKGTQYSAPSAPTLVVPALVVRTSPAVLSMWPPKHVSHIQGFGHLLLFSNPTHKTKIGIANRWDTTKSEQPMLCEFSPEGEQIKRLWTANFLQKVSPFVKSMSALDSIGCRNDCYILNFLAPLQP